MQIRTVFCLSAVLLAFGATPVAADVPQLINYQGILLDSDGKRIVDPVNVVFAIWDAATDGDSVWSEEQVVDPDKDGLFNILLGESSPIGDEAFSAPDRWLGVTIEGDPEMTPRVRITSVGYSHRVATVDGTTGGVISGDVAIQSDLDVDGQLHVTGNVGIGTESPTTALHIEKPGGDMLLLSASQVGGSAPRIGLYNPDNGFATRIQAKDGTLLAIEQGSTERFRISEGGNVGIGTTTPTYKLDVNGAISASTYYGDGSNLTGIPVSTDNDWTISGSDVYHLSGNVGIGTTSPAYRLDVGGNARISGILNLTTTSAGEIMGDGTHILNLMNAGGIAIQVTNAEDILFMTNNLTRLITTSTGNVGIGTTNPARTLDVSGQARISSGSIFAPTHFAFLTDGGAAQSAKVGALAITSNYSNDPPTNGLYVQGNVGIGTKNPASKLHVSGSSLLDGSLTVNGNINLNNNYIDLGSDGLIWWNASANDLYLGASADQGIVFRFAEPSRKLRFSHDGATGVLASVIGGLSLDAQNNTITAERMNPAAHNTYYLGGIGDRWADGYFVNLHSSNGVVTGHLMEGALPIDNDDIEDGDVIQYDPEKETWAKCRTERSLDLVSVASRYTPEEIVNDPENHDLIRGVPITVGVYHVKVTGKVGKGQILVSSSTPGHAMAVNATPKNMPYMIGKPVELKDSEGSGAIRAYFNIK